MDTGNLNDAKQKQRKKLLSLFWIIVAFLYFISPFDMVPDSISVGGWIDDCLVLIVVLVNFIQQQFFQDNESVNQLLNFVKLFLVVSIFVISTVFYLIIFFFGKN